MIVDAQRLKDIDMNTLNFIIRRLENDEHVIPLTEEEKKCYTLINDIDGGARKVEGSTTLKKQMWNEIWALMSKLGSSSWFITMSPADVKHPLCIYFADTKEKFYLDIFLLEIQEQLIAQNPVAAARVFNVIVEAFIKHVLGVDSGHDRLYGKTSGYYGTVEQQGRLTLHLTLLLWIKSCLSSQEIRDRITSNNSEFLEKMVQYLEKCHVGEFGDKTSDEVKQDIEQQELDDPEYVDPSLKLPIPPPTRTYTCGNLNECKSCQDYANWWKHFELDSNDLA